VTSRAKQIPWMRVLVEGMVIVVSILLALALDAWWDGVKEGEAGREYLVALRGELEVVRAELRTDQEARTRRFETMGALLSNIASQRPASPDSVTTLLGSLWGSVRLNPPSAVYDDLQATGSLVTSRAIRGELLQYRQRLSRLMWQEERLQDTWETELRPYLVAQTDVLRHIPRTYGVSDDWLPIPIHESGYETILRDRTFQNLLLVRLRRLSLAMVNGDTLLEGVDRLLALIEQEVG